MKKSILISLLVLLVVPTLAQQKKKEHFLKSMYIQWGYNTEWYTKSNLHFRMANGNNFKVLNVVAHDSRDYDAIPKKPLQVSIPQYNYRIGFYLNHQKTKALEINFDHAKYIVTDYQTARVKGTIDGKQVDADSVLNPATFFHFEHTDGANFMHINYVENRTLAYTKHNNRKLFTWVWKAGAGLVIPRTDFTWRGSQMNNMFHIAGYDFGVESGFRLYALKNWFIETTAKTGYARYINALANTNELKGNRVSHGIGYLELIATIGYDLNW